MIAKISSSNSLAATLGYNFKKVEKHEASVLLVQGLFHDRNGAYSRAQVLADMLRTIPERCRTKKTVFHCSLNPHPDEKLSDEALSRIAAEYMEALGYGAQPYIVFRHNDIPRAHIHIVSLRVDSEGRKIDDRFERRRSKRITDALEAKFGLMPSSPSQKKMDVSAQPSAVDINAGDIKRQVAAAVEHVLGRYAFQSVGEMNLLLTRFRVTAEEVKTERKGRSFDGIVYAALRRHFEQSKGVVRERSGAIRRAIADVMQTSPDRAEFIDRMRGHGIETVTRINAAGRLYGITFIDDANGIAVNGSRLGKGFAANVFNAYFAGGANPFIDEGWPKEKEERAAVVDELTESPNDMPPMEIDLSLQVHGADLRELAFQRRLRNRARVRLRRKLR